MKVSDDGAKAIRAKHYDACRRAILEWETHGSYLLNSHITSAALYVPDLLDDRETYKEAVRNAMDAAERLMGERDEARAEADRLRDALKEISETLDGKGWMRQVAKIALGGGDWRSYEGE